MHLTGVRCYYGVRVSEPSLVIRMCQSIVMSKSASRGIIGEGISLGVVERGVKVVADRYIGGAFRPQRILFKGC